MFEVNAEALVARDPEVLVVLFSEDSDPETARQVLAAFPGIDAVTAVQDERILTQPFELTDPPNPFSVMGLESLADQLADLAG